MFCLSLYVSDLFCKSGPAEDGLPWWQKHQGEPSPHSTLILSLLHEPLFFPAHLSSPRNCVHCFSHINGGSVAMDSKSLPRIRGLICLDNMQILQPFAAEGGSGGQSIIIPHGSKLLIGRILYLHVNELESQTAHVQFWSFLMKGFSVFFFHLALCLCLACLLQKLASVSPDLPKLVELLTVHQPKENEILLLGGLEASDTCQTRPHSPSQVSLRRCLQILANVFSPWTNWPGVRGRGCKLFFHTAVSCD